MPGPDADTPKVDTESVLNIRTFDFGGLTVSESIGPDGELILWALDADPGAGGTYSYPYHEDPSIPLRHTRLGHRLAALSLPAPGRCNATRSDGGHCRMPEGRCRFHDSAITLF